MFTSMNYNSPKLSSNDFSGYGGHFTPFSECTHSILHNSRRSKAPLLVISRFVLKNTCSFLDNAIYYLHSSFFTELPYHFRKLLFFLGSSYIILRSFVVLECSIVSSRQIQHFSCFLRQFCFF